MTIQSYMFLRRLKKVQINEDNVVCFNDAGTLIFTSQDQQSDTQIKIDISNYKHSVRSILTYLETQGMVIVPKRGLTYVKVTHAGWRTTQIQIGRLLHFLATSVFVPIVVSAATALISLWVVG